MKLCTCCIRCEKHCLCNQDCFNEGATFEEDRNGICRDCIKEDGDKLKHSLDKAIAKEKK